MLDEIFALAESTQSQLEKRASNCGPRRLANFHLLTVNVSCWRSTASRSLLRLGMSRRHKQQMHRPAYINPSLFGVLLSGTPLTRDVCPAGVSDQSKSKTLFAQGGARTDPALTEQWVRMRMRDQMLRAHLLTSPLISSEWRRQALIIG